MSTNNSPAYRSGWNAARRLPASTLWEIADQLWEGSFEWFDLWAEKPSADYLRGFKDSAWAFTTDP